MPAEKQYVTIPDGDGWEIGAGWYGADVGYEEHDGTVFMGGALYNQPAVSPYVPVTPLLATVPAKWRPRTPVTVAVPVWVVEAVNASQSVLDIGTPPYDPPALIDVTVGDDGTITLAELPPAVNDAPTLQHQEFGNEVSDFTAPFCYQIPLGALTWPVASQAAHQITWKSLAPYLGENFENIDAQYAIDAARLLLRGRVQARRNGAGYGQPLLTSLPPSTTDLLSQNENYFTVELETAEGDSRISTYACRVIRNLAGYFQNNVLLLDDTHYIFPPEYSGAGAPYRVLMQTPPWWQFSMPFNADDDVPWGTSVSPVLYPANNTGENPNFFTYDADGNITGFNSNYSQGDIPGWSTIAGVMINPRNAESVQSIFGNPGLPWQATADDPDLVMGVNSFDVSAAVDIAQLIANFDPPPDWVAVAVGARVSINSGDWFAPSDLFIEGALNVAGDAVDSFASAVDLSYVSGAPNNGPQGWLDNFGAWTIPPGGSGYDADPHNPYRQYLWRPGDAPEVATLTGSGTVRYGFPFGGGVHVAVAVAVYPFYEIGRNWILGGDVIRLDGGGWQLPYNAPSTVYPGAGEVGVLPRDAAVGVQGATAAAVPSGNAGALSGVAAASTPRPGPGTVGSARRRRA